ncbi:MAG: hypothetical protein GX224_04875 [Thermoplasmatales archaeon]|nr:hypothetical protein [Thermoplasmatales archaeon]
MHLEDMFPPVDMDWLGKARLRYASAVVGARNADRIPVDPMMLGHATVSCGYTIRDFYTKPELGVRCMAYAQELYDLLPVTKYHFAHPWLTELGLELKPMDLTAPVPVNVPVPDAEAVEALEAPSLEEIKNGFSYRKLVGTMDYTKEHIPEMFVPLAYCPEPVGSAAQLCGLEQFLMWTVTDMDLVKKLISVYIDTAVTAAGAIADRFGMAVINTGAVFENSDTMSPETIAEISPPALDRLVKGCLKKGAGPQIFYHFCGNHKDDYMLYRDTILFTPLTIMQMGYWDRVPFPSSVMRETFGDMCTIMPSVDTKLFALGNLKAIYEQARDQILGGRDSKNGFILGTACEVPPLSYPASIHTLVRAAKDFGSYGTW